MITKLIPICTNLCFSPSVFVRGKIRAKVLFTIWVKVRPQGYHSYRHQDDFENVKLTATEQIHSTATVESLVKCCFQYEPVLIVCFGHESSSYDFKPWHQSNVTELMENVAAYAILIIKFAKRRKHSQKPSHRTLQNVSPVSKRLHYGHNLIVSHTSIMHHAINVGGYNDFVTAGTA